MHLQLQIVFVLFVDSAVKCFEILAWPLIALVYPLWASIRAIEADDSSSSECRKLIAYWVLFSLIFLFEQAFHSLLLWQPLWLYLKFIITFGLVINNFDGALYVYKHLVCPCLSVDLKSLINKFYTWIATSMQGGIVEDEEKRKQNEHIALEGPFVSEVKCRQQNVAKSLQRTEQMKEGIASPEMKFVPNFLQEIKGIASPEMKFVPNFPQEINLGMHNFAPAEIQEQQADHIEIREAIGQSLGIQPPKQVQKEWTCAACQVTTQSETTLYSHLQGNRHKMACEELKSKAQQNKTKDPPIPEVKQASVVETDENIETIEEVKEITRKVRSRGKRRSKGVDMQLMSCNDAKQDLTQAKKQQQPSESTEDIAAKREHLTQAKKQRQPSESTEDIAAKREHLTQAKKQQQPSESTEDIAAKREQRKNFKLRKKYVESKEGLWWCKICNVSCSRIENMDDHLHGKKHLNQTKQVNAQAAAKSKAQ